MCRRPNPRCRRRRAALAGVLLAAATPFADAAEVPPLALEGLDLLHHGRLRAAEERFDELGRVDPDSSASAFFLAYASWWRLFDAESPEAGLFEDRIERALASSRARLDGPRGAEESLYNGLSHLFRAHVRSRQKRYLSAARDGKAARKRLLRAQRLDPELVDAQFGLGLYNYFADNVPVVVKSIRRLLFLPGGDAEVGLRQLRTVAEEGRLFRTEGRLVLATLFLDDGERRYCAAAAELRAAAAERPDAPAVLYALADLYRTLGRPHDAEPLARRALALYDELPEPAEPVAHQSARLLLAQLAYDQHDLATSLALLDPGLGPWASDDLERKSRLLLAALYRLTGDGPALEQLVARSGDLLQDRSRALQWGPPWDLGPRQVARLSAAVDHRSGGPAGAEALVGVGLDADVPWRTRFEAARLLWHRGEWDQLGQVVAALGPADGKSPERRGWLSTWNGQLADIDGRRDRALAHYREAWDTPGFRADSLAHFLADHPFEPPLCGPSAPLPKVATAEAGPQSDV